MPTAMIHPNSPALVPSTTSSPNHASMQLRRATYVHVSDLTNSYNMDHARLEEELARAKAEQQQKQLSPDVSLSSSPSSLRAGVPTELDTSHTQRRLQPPRTGFNLCVLVGEVNIVVDKLRVDGSRVRLAEVEVGDETGVVSLRARDEQIDLLQELSDKNGTVVLRNCTLELYQGKHIRLAVTKWGKMNNYPDQIASTPPPPSKINRDRNFSLIDLSVVASELVNESFPFSPHQSSPDSDSQSPSAPRTPQYGLSHVQVRHKAGRRPPTYNKAGGPLVGHSGHPGHYAEQQGLPHVIPTYHHMSAMQGYADVTLSPYPYGQPENMLPPQLMYQRQQYQMQQQRQLQHMYQAHGDQRHSMQQTPVHATGVPPSTHFDSTGVGGANRIADAHTPSVTSVPSSTPTARPPSGSMPPSPGMNPRATSFDPNQK